MNTATSKKAPRSSTRWQTWVPLIAVVFQGVMLIIAALGVWVTWSNLKDANKGIREIVNARSRQALDKVAVLSAELSDRRYLFHEFGANATISAEELVHPTATGTSASRRILKVLVEPWGENAYGGINIFGNDCITGRFVPVDLGRVKTVTLDFSYPAHQEGRFFIRFKDARNFETFDIPIDAEGQAGEFRRFEFTPTSHKPISDVLRRHGEFLVMNISVATDFTRYKWIGKAEIELRDLVFQMK